ncbi:MAG TPA: hypothetical protein VJU86_09580 [Pyrinomonadaceae bacterium]|nr:hypothetical protein [Pyrinomonadaceae bacterium]
MNKLRISVLTKFTLLIAFLLMNWSNVAAQSTVFNIPATDVQSPGQVYLEANFIMHYGSIREGGYRNYGPRVVVGLPGNTEVGVNVYYTRALPAEPIDVQPNFKWQFYSNEETGLAFATGVLVSTPVTRRSLGTTSAQVYVVGSKTFSGFKDPRVTFGGYKLFGDFEDGTDKSGILLGYEQPITKKISFVTDWSSGNNDYGYLVVGTGITFSPKSLLYAGYNFGNQGRSNNSLGIFYGHTF